MFIYKSNIRSIPVTSWAGIDLASNCLVLYVHTGFRNDLLKNMLVRTPRVIYVRV